MDLHYLDSGGARFLEIQLFLVLKGSLPLELFEATAKHLVNLWPVLNTRMNFLRTSLSSIDQSDINGLWKATKLSARLDEKIPSLDSPIAKRTIDSLVFHQLFPKNDGFYDTLFPRNFKIRAIQLEDACVLRFTFQHPFCDAGGLHRVIKAYCDLLQGRNIPQPDFNISLDLSDDSVAVKSSDSDPQPEPAALRHREYFNSGWSAVVAGAWKHRVHGRNGPERSNKTFLVPKGIVDRLATAAEAAGIQVTRHDLLLALIHKVSMTGAHIPPAPLSPPTFSFIMNFSRLLRNEPFLHNPWMLVILPELSIHEASQTTHTLQIAKHIRSTIIDTRRPQVVKQIMEQQKNVRAHPFVPVHYAAHEPQISVSSWTHIPLFDLDFPSEEEGKILRPTYVQCSVNLCPFLSLGGLTIDDAILTWASDEGFWMQGYIDDRIWGRLEDLRRSLA